MNRRLLSALSVFLISVFCIQAEAQNVEPTPLSQTQKQAISDSIASAYYPWEKISISGKLSSPMLPISASVKIYMEKERLVVISISAIFVGEVARIEIDQKEALIVNKYKNTYTTIETIELEPICPGGLTALQNLILGRINILGRGELNSETSRNVDIYPLENNQSMILPEQDLENAPYVYYYTVNNLNLLLDKFVVMAQDESGVVTCSYTWAKKDYSIDLTATLNGRSINGIFKLNNPDAAPKPIDRIELNSKYKKTNISGVLKM